MKTSQEIIKGDTVSFYQMDVMPWKVQMVGTVVRTSEKMAWVRRTSDDGSKSLFLMKKRKDQLAKM